MTQQLGFELRDKALERLEMTRAHWIATARNVARVVCDEQAPRSRG